MKRMSVLTGLLCLSGLFLVQDAHAQQTVEIFLKSKKAPIKDAVIANESVKGVLLKGTGERIPPDDIDEVDYTYWIPATEAKSRGPYQEAFKFEKDAAKTSGATREDNLNKAIGKYKDALAELPKELLYPRQQSEFKIAFLNGILGLGGNQVNRTEAIKKLIDFKKNNADTWQFTPTLVMLVKLQAEEKNFEAVRATVKELTTADVSPKVKGDAKMLVVRLLMEAGDALLEKKDFAKGKEKYTEAQKEAENLLPEIPKDSPGRLHVSLMLAQCKAIVGDAKQKQEATTDMEKLLKETTDKEMKAAVYNQLGELYFKDGRLQDARWQFLWVDVVYNQDKEQHARALYWLWKIFNNLGEAERGQEFFETLATPRFTGTYYQDKAKNENKAAS